MTLLLRLIRRVSGGLKLRIEGPAEHALGPAKGVVAGLTLSVLIWSAMAALVAFVLI